MKKNLLICSIIFSFFILSFSSCINSDFDLGDDKLDTTVDVGDSISVPVGDIQRINVYDELKKVYHDSLGVRPNGVLYVKYDGTFNIEFPDFKLLEIDVNPPDEEVNLRGPDGNTPPSGVELPISSFVSADEIISGEVDVIEAPRLGDSNITLAPEKIEFTSLTLEAGFTFSGLDFFPEDNNAIVEVILVIPKKYDVEGLGEYREIKKEFPFNQIKDGSSQSLGELKVKSYMFGGNEKLCYRVYLKKGNATSFSLDGLPKFTFSLKPKAGSPNPPEVSSLQCRLDGTTEITGTEDRFSSLQGAFDENDTLIFRDPSLSLTLTTNLNTSFGLNVNMRSSSAALDELWNFEKPSKDTTASATFKANPDDLRKLISTPFPEKLEYTVSLGFKDAEATLRPKEDMVLSANYSFEIPFDFEKISLNLEDTITGLFNEDTYEQIFSHIDDIAIKADLESSIGDGIRMGISAIILDSTFQEIKQLVTVETEEVLKNRSTLTITISKENEEDMKKARHLKFTFTLSGSGAIKRDDYIDINNVRLVSSKGIHYEL